MPDKNKLAEYSYQYLINKGLSPTAAAGIVGNLKAESGFDPSVVGKADSTGSIGLAQWNYSRKDNLINFAKQKGTSHTDLNTQLDFIVHELNQPAFKKAKDSLYSAKSPDEAAMAFMNHYEKPAEWAKKQSSPLRVNTARELAGQAPDPNFQYQSEEQQQNPFRLKSEFVSPLYTNMPHLGGAATMPEEEATAETEHGDAIAAANDLREESFVKDYADQQQAQEQQYQPQDYEQVAPQAIAPIEYQPIQPIQQDSFQDGGEWFDEAARELPYNMMHSQPNQEYSDAMRGMMKSKIGYGNAFEHPSIQRMSQATPKEGMTPEGLGTHYMSSHENYATPLLQDKGGNQLQYINNPAPSSEDIYFERPEDAAHFGEHYKEVAPMSTIYKGLQEYQQGGVVKDNEGYWNPNNWGKVVEINSPNITMQNVYEPLLGVSKQTGEQKIMHPGQNYTFQNTDQVIEYPINKKKNNRFK